LVRCLNCRIWGTVMRGIESDGRLNAPPIPRGSRMPNDQNGSTRAKVRLNDFSEKIWLRVELISEFGRERPCELDMKT
jgi:hypothetical protein